MFQTKFDRWLIEHFVYEHHISVMQLPDRLPFGIKKVELPSANRAGYKYRLEIKNPKTANKVISSLRDNGLSFKTHIAEKDHWYNWLINNKKKSFSFRVFWWINISVLLFLGITSFVRFTQTDRYADIKEQFIKVMAPSNR